MDEVDLDGEDYNELEARLYGQIHHEAVALTTVEGVNNAQEAHTKNKVERIVTERSVVNRPTRTSRVPDTRYWANSLKTTKPVNTAPQAELISKSVISDVNHNKKLNDNENSSTHIALEVKASSNKSIENDPENASENQWQSQTPINDAVQQQESHTNTDNTPVSNLLINPAAVVKNSKANLKKKKLIDAHGRRTGPFKQQETKLQKALLVQAKKKKSKNVRKKKGKRQPQVETILVDSSSDSTSGTEDTSDDDVVLIPTKPPPTITVSDSDNEGNGVESSAIQLEEENAMDASDVVMDSKTKSNDFTKPTKVRSYTTQDAHEKHAEQVPSRGTSPCSVLSSDDFIGQTDRSRLLEDNCMADDQDLVLLTADVDSLMQPPQRQANNPKQANAATINSATEEVICTGQFTAPLSNSTTVTEANNKFEKQNKQQKKYRVDQTEFRAMDVYESESDITDNVYSKGAGRVRTIVNAIDSSSEADDVQQTPINQKLKRLSKRRTSSSNRGSDANYDGASTDDELDAGVTKTPVSFIMRGTAVECCNKKMRKRTQSLGSRRTSAGGVASAAGNMSDTEFIATLNSLVQGREDDENKGTEGKTNEEDNWDDDMQSESNQRKNVENQVEPQQSTGLTLKLEPDQVSVQSVQIIEPPPLPASVCEAVPDDAMAGLDKIFASIDNMVEPTFKKKISESEDNSEDEIEVIHPPVPVSIEAERREIKNALPIRHIVYNGHNFQMGGVGWNEEMIKFYNFSWHGERFTVTGVQKGMERDRNLWKIYTEDRFPKMRPYSNLKCYNCCEFGHTRAKCRRPKKPPICYMCGESGHFEPRCPNTICLRCGNKTQVFTKSCNACTFQNRLICPICKVRGHSINLCPDKWRRYHSTTQPNAHPNSQIEFNKRRMCCVCGGSGHLSDTCRSAVRFTEYPIIVSHVKSHQKSYSDLLFKSPRIGLALNLLYKPGDAVAFHMAEKTPPDGYYWRFLKAVGLGSMLRRKRPGECLTAPEKRSKQARNRSAKYEPNPYGKAAREVVQTTDKAEADAAPNQVQEVSGSESTAEAITLEAKFADLTEDISADGFADMEYINEANETVAENTPEVDVVKNGGNVGNEFKAPGEASTTTHHTTQHKDNLTVDSDSNYSFSDHFEIPPAAGCVNKEMHIEEDALDVQPSTSAAARGIRTAKRVCELEPLPDFIPLTDSSLGNTCDVVDNFDTNTGISRRFVAADTDEEIEEDEAQPGDVPCEAKIYLTQLHSNFLLSPGGNEFLVQKSKECNIKARLDWTSVGHVLIIFGHTRDQDTFHKALLEKCDELMDQTNKKHLSSTKVPKRIDALIRFLRENISQLQSDLGDVNDLQRRIKNLDQTHTKANMKMAEKFRRLLNMILLGQAGLCDGDKHLDKLLVNLKSLINNYQAENMVPQSLREEIDSHSKMIFTSYRHDNYPDLIQTYNSLPKSRQLILNIDPLLLGQKMLNVSLTAEQRARLEQPPNPATPLPQFNQITSAKKSADIESNSPNVTKSKLINKQKDSTQASKSQARISNEPPCSSKASNRTPNTTPAQSPAVASTRDKSNTSTPNKRQAVSSPPFINPQKKSTVITKFKDTVQTQKSLLEDLIDNDTIPSAGGTDFSAAKRAPSKGPSVFWSRESMHYLDECIQLAESNTELLLKLQRIQSKSAEGALSYNDYRAVIKLHGAMVGH